MVLKSPSPEENEEERYPLQRLVSQSDFHACLTTQLGHVKGTLTKRKQGRPNAQMPGTGREMSEGLAEIRVFSPVSATMGDESGIKAYSHSRFKLRSYQPPRDQVKMSAYPLTVDKDDYFVSQDEEDDVVLLRRCCSLVPYDGLAKKAVLTGLVMRHAVFQPPSVFGKRVSKVVWAFLPFLPQRYTFSALPVPGPRTSTRTTAWPLNRRSQFGGIQQLTDPL